MNEVEVMNYKNLTWTAPNKTTRAKIIFPMLIEYNTSHKWLLKAI